MGIRLDVDRYLICNLFNVDTKKLSNEYLGMTIEEIMEAEAAQGNKEARGFNAAVLNDPVKLIELFELKNPNNKYRILSNMNERDLDNLLPLLEQDDLVSGLNFFSKDKILAMVEDLPIKQLIKYTMQMFSPAHLMALMPEEQLNNVLKSTDIDKEKELKIIQSLAPSILVKMYEAATGNPVPGMDGYGIDGKPNIDRQKLYQEISILPADKFQEAMLSIPTAHKQEVVFKLAELNPKLYEAIDPGAYTDIINKKKDKSDMLKYADTIEHEQLVKMNQHLPKELTAVVLTLLDPTIFAKKLISNFQDILKQIVAG